MINDKAPEESDKTPLTKPAMNRRVDRILGSPRGIMALALGFGLLIWITHALLDYFVFYKGYGTFLELLITRPPAHEIYIRLVILAYFVVFGIIISLQGAERRRAEMALRESERKYRSYIDYAPDGVFIANAQGRYIEVNPAACAITGYTHEELLTMSFQDLVPPDGQAIAREHFGRVVHTGYASSEVPFVHKDGSRHYWLVDAVQIAPERFMGFVRDVTDRIQAEAQVEHLNRVLRAIRNVNQLIVQEKDPACLIQGACDNLVETRGYHNAWIALVVDSLPQSPPTGGEDAVEGPVLSAAEGPVLSAAEGPLTAEAGLGETFDPLRERLQQGTLTDCGQRALAQSGVVIIQDPASACPDCPLAAKYAGRAAMTVRLEHGGRVYGLLAVSIPIDLAADEEEQALFQEVAGDIAFALHNIEGEEERKRAEEALRESEARFRQVYEHMAVGVARVSLDFRIKSANEAYCRMLGYREEKLIGKHLKDITHPETVEENLRKQSQLAAGASDHYRMEKRFIHKSGRVVHGILDANLVRDAEGNPYYFLGSVLDITARKRMEEALRANETLLRNVIDADPSCIFLKDGNGKFLLVNQAMAKLHGTTPEAMVGKTDADCSDDALATPEEIEQFRQDDLEVIKQKKPKIVPVESFTLSDGMVKWFQTYKVPIFIEGRGDGLLGVAVDITGRKRAEMHLEQALAEKTALVQELYHRTRNNMQVIQAMLHIYAGRIADTRVAEVFREMEDRIHTMALAHQKLYESQNLSRINLREYILDLFDHLKGSYRGAAGRFADDITLIEEMEEVSVLIDTAAPCGLVLNELLSNIFKHAFPENMAGEVRINLARTSDGKIDLVVADNGVGVPDGFDSRTCKTLGIQNMIAIVEYQLRGEIIFEAADGVTCHLRFRDDLYEERV